MGGFLPSRPRVLIYKQTHLNVACFLHRPEFLAPQQHTLEHAHPLPPRREEGVVHFCSMDVLSYDARDGAVHGARTAVVANQ